MPRIRTLKTEVATFYSENMLSSEKKEKEEDEPEKEEKEGWTTRGGIGNGWHGGLYVDAPRSIDCWLTCTLGDSFINSPVTQRCTFYLLAKLAVDLAN
jgi:hypothetical protein